MLYASYDKPPSADIGAGVFVPDGLIRGDIPRMTDTVTIAAGQQLSRGTLIGQTKFAAPSIVAASSTGNGTVGSMTLGVNSDLGAYVLRATSSTNFTVTTPNGVSLLPATVGTPYVDPKINFTITAGSTAFVAGDSFTLTVGPSIGQWVLSAASATDGSQVPGAILIDSVDTTGGPISAGVFLTGVFDPKYVTFGAGMTAAISAPFLRPDSIYFRASVSGVPI